MARLTSSRLQHMRQKVLVEHRRYAGARSERGSGYATRIKQAELLEGLWENRRFQSKEEHQELQPLKRFASDVGRLEVAQRDLRREMGQLEKDLEVSGSTRTTDDIHAELETHARDLCALSNASTP